MITALITAGRRLKLIGFPTDVAVLLSTLDDMTEQAQQMLSYDASGFANTPVPKMFFAEIQQARELLQCGKLIAANRFIADARARLRFIELNLQRQGATFVSN